MAWRYRSSGVRMAAVSRKVAPGGGYRGISAAHGAKENVRNWRLPAESLAARNIMSERREEASSWRRRKASQKKISVTGSAKRSLHVALSEISAAAA